MNIVFSRKLDVGRVLNTSLKGTIRPLRSTVKDLENILALNLKLDKLLEIRSTLSKTMRLNGRIAGGMQREHSFSTYAKFSRKLTFLTP